MDVTETLCWYHYVAVTLLGSVVGFSEILQRYSYSTKDILRTLSMYPYVLLNAFSSFIVLGLFDYFDFYMGGEPQSAVSKVMISGLAGMILLRSSFFTISSNGKDYDVGLGILTNVFLTRADRSFDQERAKKHAPKLASMMENVDFNKAKTDLTTLCLALMQNLPNDLQRNLREEVDVLSRSDSMLETKSIILGVTISKYTGVELLEQAINSLGEKILLSDDPEYKQLESEADQIIQELSVGV